MITSLFEPLKYDSTQPLIFSSGLFLVMFLFFSGGYYLLRKQLTPRILYVIAFSLFFYYKTSGMYFLLLVAVSIGDYVFGHFIHTAKTRARKRLMLVLSLSLNLGILGYFKYTNFLLEIFSQLADKPFEFQNIFLPIGISFFTFQSLSYIIDIYRGQVTPLKRYVDYLFFVSFFPQLVAGPIVRARDFIPQINQNPIFISRAVFGEGIFLIIGGLFKKAVISDYISLNFVDRIFDNPTLYTGFENLMGLYGYALQIYCDFSGYSDMAIGIALLLGFRFKPNFDSPYKSATITEFWRRWHISLSTWLRDYLYISLGGNRKGKFRTYINLMITMLLGGLWHGAAWRFIIWGGLHGAALAVHKMAMSLFPGFKTTGGEMPRWRRMLGIIFTFNLVCLGWVLFRADSVHTAGEMLSQIFMSFHPEIAFDFIKGYKWVFLLIVIGYLLHFTSANIEAKILAWFKKAPIIIYAIILTALIWLIMQIHSGEVQPFIYFQF